MKLKCEYCKKTFHSKKFRRFCGSRCSSMAWQKANKDKVRVHAKNHRMITKSPYRESGVRFWDESDKKRRVYNPEVHSVNLH